MRVAAVSLTARPAPVAQAMRQLKYAGALCVVFMILEVIGGSIANSLAIMTDAAHLLSDLLSFAIGCVSSRAARPCLLRVRTHSHAHCEILWRQACCDSTGGQAPVPQAHLWRAAD